MDMMGVRGKISYGFTPALSSDASRRQAYILIEILRHQFVDYEYIQRVWEKDRETDTPQELPARREDAEEGRRHPR